MRYELISQSACNSELQAFTSKKEEGGSGGGVYETTSLSATTEARTGARDSMNEGTSHALEDVAVRVQAVKQEEASNTAAWQGLLTEIHVLLTVC